jgi:hypothetical protein
MSILVNTCTQEHPNFVNGNVKVNLHTKLIAVDGLQMPKLKCVAV